MNNTPSGERTHIALLGKRNAGKSSLANAITGQDIAIVSDIKGTTTDPVYKAMELLPLGPVQIIDTPGIDDIGTLGELRMQKTNQILNKADIVLFVCEAGKPLADIELSFLESIKRAEMPYIVVYNKADLLSDIPSDTDKGVYVSATTGYQINHLKDVIANTLNVKKEKYIVSDLIKKDDVVVLVIPIDSAAPKGRLILPQQQVIREILDSDATAFVCKEHNLKQTLDNLVVSPRLVITDSQIFHTVEKQVPREIPLTSFSILMARYKGDLSQVVSGAKALKQLQDNDQILIAEGCTHHRQCNDIGTVKIPKGLAMYTKKALEINTCSGGDFPKDLSSYSLVIHCGGCMLTPKEVKSGMEYALSRNVPVTNYGILLAHINGILERSIEIFM